MAEEATLNTVELATELTIAWLGNPNVRPTAEDVPAFLKTIHDTICDLGTATGGDGDDGAGNGVPADSVEEFKPAVTVRKSLASRDHLISLIDGKPYKTLRRHLSGHGLTPEQYRERYNLKADYPMVAPAYSEARSAMAHRIGLGSKGRAARQAASVPKAAAPAKTVRGRGKAAAPAD